MEKNKTNGPSEEQKETKKSKKGGKALKTILIVLIVLAVLGGGVFVLGKLSAAKKNAAAASDILKAQTERRSIVSVLSGSGTLQPADSYTVTTLVQGEIQQADFEEGDTVSKDDVLYVIDSSDVANNIERSQISLEQAQRSYDTVEDTRYVKATVSGTVCDLYVDEGDEVSPGQQLGLVRDSAVMLVTVPFPADETELLFVGQDASVTLDGSFETLPGRIDSFSGSNEVGAGGVITRGVTIAVSNPGGIAPGQLATASVGDVCCSGSGSFRYNAEAVLFSQAAGTVVSIDVPEGQNAEKDEVVLTLGGEKLENTIKNAADGLRNAELACDSSQDQLDSYTIKSPISGTIVDKQYKAGDKAEAGRPMCIIYDLSYLEMTIAVDELDISSVEVGQKVDLTAEAVEGKSYSGIITKVSIVGTTGVGGATSYPVTVRVEEYEGLRPGMNADAEIEIAAAENVLAVPVGAINRGDTVTVTPDSPSAKGAPADAVDANGNVTLPVETGISDDDYIEIVSGLSEGDTVVYHSKSALTLMEMFAGRMAEFSGGEGGGSGAVGGGFGGGMVAGMGG